MSGFLTDGMGNTPLFNLIVNIVVLIIGISMAFASGRAIAQTWRPVMNVPVYVLILAAAERFLHYALAGQPLLSITYYLISFIILLAIGLLGYRRMRVQQMLTQYSWLYSPDGQWGWKNRV